MTASLAYRWMRSAGVAFGCALVGIGTATASTAAPSFPPSTVAQINAAIAGTLTKFKAPGAIVGISIPGRGTYVVAKGKGNIATGEAMQVADHMRIGSVTKTFTNTVLLQLVAKNVVRLDDPVGKYLGFVPNGRKITLRMLSNMTAGLFNYTENPNFGKAVEKRPEREWTPRELVDLGLADKPYFAPGTGWHYSNTNTVLLGMVIEKITKQRIGSVFQERIFAPLGLFNTVWPATTALPAPHAHGITRLENGKTVDATSWSPSEAGAAGQLISTVRDMMKWAKACATGAQLPAALQQQRLKWVTFKPLSEQTRYGLGIMYRYGWLGHNGSIPGYTSNVFYLPSQDATIVVLVNSDIAVDHADPASALFAALTRILTPKNAVP